jgi:hypothetical protein
LFADRREFLVPYRSVHFAGSRPTPRPDADGAAGQPHAAAISVSFACRKALQRNVFNVEAG